MLHDFDEEVATGMESKTFKRFMDSERDYFLNTDESKRVLASFYLETRKTLKSKEKFAR